MGARYCQTILDAWLIYLGYLSPENLAAARPNKTIGSSKISGFTKLDSDILAARSDDRNGFGATASKLHADFTKHKARPNQPALSGR